MTDIVSFDWQFSAKHPFEIYREDRPSGGILEMIDIHQPIHLQYVISGIMTGRFGDSYFDLKQDEIMMNSPWEIHGDDRYTPDFKMVNLVVAQDIVKDLLLNSGERLDPFLYQTPEEHRKFLNRPDVHDALVPLFMEIWDAQSNDPGILYMKRWLLIQQICVTLLEFIPSCPKYSAHMRKLAPALDLAARGPCTAAEAAAACGFSENYFGCMFRETFHTTFSAYQQEQRLNRAAVKLRKGMSVKQAAASENFYDSSYFIKCFVKRFGVLPGKYR